MLITDHHSHHHGNALPQRITQTFAMPTGSSEQREKQAEMQGLLCGVVQVRRLRRHRLLKHRTEPPSAPSRTSTHATQINPVLNPSPSSLFNLSTRRSAPDWPRRATARRRCCSTRTVRWRRCCACWRARGSRPGMRGRRACMKRRCRSVRCGCMLRAACSACFGWVGWVAFLLLGFDQSVHRRSATSVITTTAHATNADKC